MRLKDLDTTTEYAYRTGSRYSPPVKIRVQDAEKLWCQPVRKPWTPEDTPKLRPAGPGVRATRGDSFTGPVGVLITYVNKPENGSAIAYPARILCTWAEYEAEAAAEKEAQRKHSLARLNQEQENERNSARIKELLAQHPEITGIHAPDYRSNTTVPYTTLIQILEALPNG